MTTVPRVAIPELSELLDAWDAAAPLPEVARGAALLPSFGLASGIDSALDLPLSLCAAHASAAFVEVFGPTIEVLVDCGVCKEAMEVALDLPSLADHATMATAQRHVETSTGDVVIVALTTRDLLAAGNAPDGATELLARCVRHTDGSRLADGELCALSATQIAAIEQAAEDLAGPASTDLLTECPNCGAAVSARIEFETILWQQVASVAHRALAEVALLARGFGWSEQAVLELSPARRDAYLGLLSNQAGGSLSSTRSSR